MRCGLFQKCVSVRHYKYGDAKYSPYSGSVAEIPASVPWCRIETQRQEFWMKLNRVALFCQAKEAAVG